MWIAVQSLENEDCNTGVSCCTNEEAHHEQGNVLLLTEMADRYYETKEEEIVQGEFQAELNEVEHFLKLRVEEGRSCTEATLSPDDALKNYLASDETGKGRTSSSLALLSDLNKSVEEAVLYLQKETVF